MVRPAASADDAGAVFHTLGILAAGLFRRLFDGFLLRLMRRRLGMQECLHDLLKFGVFCRIGRFGGHVTA